MSEQEIFVKDAVSGYHTRFGVRTYLPEILEFFGFKARSLPVVVIDTDYENWTIGAFCDEDPYWFSKTQMFVQVRDKSKVMTNDQPLSKMLMEKLKDILNKYKYKQEFFVLQSDEKSCAPIFDNFAKEEVVPDYFDEKPRKTLAVCNYI
jgi:hypothetical protein